MSLAGFIAAQRAEHRHPARGLVPGVGVSQAWFYKWRARGCVAASGAAGRRWRRRSATCSRKHKRRYGSPRITAELQELGWRVSENTVAALMRERGWWPGRSAGGALTKAGPVGAQGPDLVGRDFSLRDKPNQVWVGDLTDIPNEEGPLYLASVLDLHSRRIVGFAMDAHHDAELARAALCMAIAVRGGEVAGVVFHTDSEYG